jgi:hypothetical protein
VAIDVEITGVAPPVEVIGEVAETPVTVPTLPDKVPDDNVRPVPTEISSIVPVPAVERPTNLFVAIDVEMTGEAPPVEVIGEVAVTPVTVPPEFDKVPPERVNPVPTEICSITPVPAVDLPTNLFVSIDVVILGVVPPVDNNGAEAVTPETPPPPPPDGDEPKNPDILFPKLPISSTFYLVTYKYRYIPC